MERLYREIALKEQPGPQLVQIELSPGLTDEPDPDPVGRARD
jgi:hypothetical protein